MSCLWLSAILIVAALGEWGCFAQPQKEGPVLPLPDPSGALGQKSCLEIRDSLERVLYVTLKGSLPRRMLKEVLPGLVDPLLPVMCLQPGSEATKWLQQHLDKLPPSSSSSSSHPLSRPKRQLNFFMPFLGGMGGMGPPGGKIKDPGDRPLTLFGRPIRKIKDPGDHPVNMFGQPVRKIKDPGDRPPPPPGEAPPVDPMMSSMMAMMQMMAFNQQMARMTAAMSANNNGRNGNNGNNGNGGAV